MLRIRKRRPKVSRAATRERETFGFSKTSQSLHTNTLRRVKAGLVEGPISEHIASFRHDDIVRIPDGLPDLRKHFQLLVLTDPSFSYLLILSFTPPSNSFSLCDLSIHGKCLLISTVLIEPGGSAGSCTQVVDCFDSGR
jgi:hypothetical protein